VLLVSTVEFLFSLPIILVAMAVTRSWPGWLILLFPVAVIVQFVFMYGLSLLVAAGSVVIPDLAHIVRIVLRALFYLSPVLYSISNIPAKMQDVAIINPLVGLLSLYRLGFDASERESFKAYGVLVIVVISVLAAALIVFRRTEPRILKEA
jgi:ABC-2 type transport system permease protein